MDRRSAVIGFVNAAHFLDHYAMLVFAAAVVVMAPAFGLGFARLLPYATPGFVAFGAGSLVAGWLGDRWSRRRMMIAFFFGLGAALIATALARTPWQIGTGLLAVGLAASIYHPVGGALLAAHARQLGRAVGINGVWGNLGVAASALVTGVICQALGWRWAFAAPGLAAIAIGAGFALSGAEEPRGLPRRVAASAGGGRALRRVAISLGLTVVASSVSFNALTLALPKLLSERMGELGRHPAAVGAAAAAAYLFGALSQYVIGRLADRLPLRSIFLPLALCVAPLLVLASRLDGAALGLACIGIVIGVFGQVTINDAMVARHAPDGWRGRAYALRYFVGFTAAGASAGLVAWLQSRGGFALMLQALGALGVLTICGALVFPSEEGATPAPEPG